MVLDEETLERMLAAGKRPRRTEQPPSRLLDATDEFEVYERVEPEGVAGTHEEHAPEDTQEYPPRRHPAPAATGPSQDAVAPPPGGTVDPGAAPQPPDLGTGPPEGGPGQAYAPVAQPPRPAPPRPQVFTPQAAPAPTGRTLAPPSPAPGTQGAPERPGPPAAAMPQTTTGGGDVPRIGLVQSDFNRDVTDLMAQWALQHAHKNGATVTRHVHVPGVYDVPLTAKVLARCDDVDCIVVVGAVVQGETAHDQLITRETARLLADIAYQSEKPVGLGIAGPGMTMKQAEARVHMGRDAVASVLQQWRALRALRA